MGGNEQSLEEISTENEERLFDRGRQGLKKKHF
jgi:hypothetical protein